MKFKHVPPQDVWDLVQKGMREKLSGMAKVGRWNNNDRSEISTDIGDERYHNNLVASCNKRILTIRTQTSMSQVLPGNEDDRSCQGKYWCGEGGGGSCTWLGQMNWI